MKYSSLKQALSGEILRIVRSYIGHGILLGIQSNNYGETSTELSVADKS